MGDAVQTVNNIHKNLKRWVDSNLEHPDKPRRVEEMTAIQSLLSEIQEYRAREMPVDPELGDLSDLPPELVKELNLNAPSELEQRIIAIIKSSDDKKANINTILVELFKRHKVVQKRRNMQNKLWRMMDQKLIWGVDGEKGVYTTNKPARTTLPGLDTKTGFEEADINDPDWEVPF